MLGSHDASPHVTLTTLHEGRPVLPTSQMGTVRLRKVERLAQGRSTSEWRSWAHTLLLSSPPFGRTQSQNRTMPLAIAVGQIPVGAPERGKLGTM